MDWATPLGYLLAAIISALITGVLSARLRPRIQKDIDEATRSKLVAETSAQAALAVSTTIKTLTDSLEAIHRENEDLTAELTKQGQEHQKRTGELQAQLDDLASKMERRDRKLRAYISRLKDTLLAHIEAWRQAVMQPDIDPEIQKLIISRVPPLPAGYDVEEPDTV